MTIAQIIAQKLNENQKQLSEQFSLGKIKHFYIDDLLPLEIAQKCAESFPKLELLKHNCTLREDKYIGVDLDKYDPIIGEVLLAFQDNLVIDAVKNITNISDLEGDKSFYAAGISAMKSGNFLNPHLDNSHNADRTKYRSLNLLYYATPDWKLENGGNLELWHNGVKKGGNDTIFSKFNRLIVMSTDEISWHSVSPIVSDGIRRCFSNYYFTKSSPNNKDYFHVTTFKSRPEQSLKVKMILCADGIIRNVLRKIKKRNVKNISHIRK
ncbi:MAG: hypothetical protein RL208_497 [Pseudomonadota bacterium]|jgi:Rps23 Pro-64 3,4-dihydroxylase Tpa1-like proline 4-hydroxylase